MNFKVGDRVRIEKIVRKDHTHGGEYVGQVGKIVEIGNCISYLSSKTWQTVISFRGNRVCFDFDEIRNLEEPMKDMKFGIKYDRDVDPVEFFKTKKEAQKRIEQLLDDSEVDKTSISLFEVGKIWEVKRPVSYKLLEVK